MFSILCVFSILRTGQCINGFRSCTDTPKSVKADWCWAFCMLKEENVDWNNLAEDRNQWLAVKIVMNGNEPLHSITCWYWVAEKVVHFLEMLICMELVNVLYYRFQSDCLGLMFVDPVVLKQPRQCTWFNRPWSCAAKTINILFCGTFGSSLSLYTTERETVRRLVNGEIKIHSFEGSCDLI
jgi:hypothetical protein